MTLTLYSLMSFVLQNVGETIYFTEIERICQILSNSWKGLSKKQGGWKVFTEKISGQMVLRPLSSLQQLLVDAAPRVSWESEATSRWRHAWNFGASQSAYQPSNPLCNIGAILD